METLNSIVNVQNVVLNKDLPHKERKLKFVCVDSTGDERHGGLIGMSDIDDRFYRKIFRDGSIYICDVETRNETLIQ